MKNSNNDKDNVKTAIRWRPAVNGRQVAVEKIDEKIISVSSRQNASPSTFVLDYVFDSIDSTQCEVYDVLVKPLVEKAFDGYDATFIAIGQTGSGKTYTVGFENSVASENNGMTARIFSHVFSHTKRINVSISFIEIYNHQAFDLLSENSHEPFYKKDHQQKYRSEATRKPVNKENVLVLLSQAIKRRRIRTTNMNSISSRSHAVLTIFLAIDGRESALNMVDLAGSESYQKTGNIGDAHKEGKSINESLSAFKRVINAMARGESYIPFRDSVITTLLKNSLNTRSYLTVIGCVSPYQEDFGETLCTVRFVSEAKDIKATPQQNAKITEFQNSKTPIKAHLRTPKPPPKSVGTFKKPCFMSSTRRRRNGLWFQIPKTEPRKHLSINAQANESICSSVDPIRNSTTKKSGLWRQSLRTSLRRSVASNLFPTTPSRQLIEDALRNDETMDWQNASTSSVMTFDQMPNNSLLEDDDSTVDQRMSLLMQKLKPLIAEKLKNDPNLEMLNLRVVGTEILDVSQRKSIGTGNYSEIKVNESTTTIKDENEQNNSQIDLANLTVDVDTTNKQILVDVSTKLSQSLHQNVNQSLIDAKCDYECECDAIKEDTFIKSPDKTRLTRNSINTAASSTKAESNFHDSTDVIERNDSKKIYETASVNHLSFGAEHSPIGKIRLRKISNKMDDSNDETYEIVIVNESQHSEIASKTTTKAHPFPVSPRIILHRINSIEEYHKSVSIQQTHKKTAAENQRKVRHKKITRIEKDQFQRSSSKSQSIKKVLYTLNTGSVKELKTLMTIGQKHASAIFDYRTNILNGDFESIDSLKRMPFWTEKKHQRFLVENSLK